MKLKLKVHKTWDNCFDKSHWRGERLTLLHSERPKSLWSFGRAKCNRVKKRGGMGWEAGKRGWREREGSRNCPCCWCRLRFTASLRYPGKTKLVTEKPKMCLQT